MFPYRLIKRTTSTTSTLATYFLSDQRSFKIVFVNKSRFLQGFLTACYNLAVQKWQLLRLLRSADVIFLKTGWWNSNIQISGFQNHLQTNSSLHIFICQSQIIKYVSIWDTLYLAKNYYLEFWQNRSEFFKNSNVVRFSDKILTRKVGKMPKWNQIWVCQLIRKSINFLFSKIRWKNWGCQ